MYYETMKWCYVTDICVLETKVGDNDNKINSFPCNTNYTKQITMQ